MTAAVMGERRARVLAASTVFVRIVVRQVRVADQVHCDLEHLGDTRGNREQKCESDQKPHDLAELWPIRTRKAMAEYASNLVAR